MKLIASGWDRKYVSEQVFSPSAEWSTHLWTCSYIFPVCLVLLFEGIFEDVSKQKYQTSSRLPFFLAVFTWRVWSNMYIWIYPLGLSGFRWRAEFSLERKRTETYLKGSGRYSWLIVILSISLLCCAGDKWIAAMHGHTWLSSSGSWFFVIKSFNAW